MIVKNGEQTLDKCLQSVKDIVDEIIIVDTGSVDKTKEIAKKYTRQIYDYTWRNNFSEARNFSFARATKDYILWLDADDILLESEKQKLESLKSDLLDTVDVVLMKYSVMLGENKGNYVFWRERLVKRERNFKWNGPVHEYIAYSGNYVFQDITVTHTRTTSSGRRNLEIYEKYVDRGNKLSQRDWYYYARELWKDNQKDKSATYFEKYLNSENGLASNYMDASIKLSDYYESQKDDKKSLKVLLQYFEIGTPRAEICCKIGNYFKRKKQYDQAIGWFMMALVTPKPTFDLGNIMPMYWGYIPYMELCACYFMKGNLQKAIYFNEKAGQTNPEDSNVQKNRVFLAMREQQLKNK